MYVCISFRVRCAGLCTFITFVRFVLRVFLNAGTRTKDTNCKYCRIIHVLHETKKQRKWENQRSSVIIRELEFPFCWKTEKVGNSHISRFIQNKHTWNCTMWNYILNKQRFFYYSYAKLLLYFSFNGGQFDVPQFNFFSFCYYRSSCYYRS